MGRDKPTPQLAVISFVFSLQGRYVKTGSVQP